MAKAKTTPPKADEPVKECNICSADLWAIGKYIESVLRARDFKSPPESVSLVDVKQSLLVDIQAKKEAGTTVIGTFDPVALLSAALVQECTGADNPTIRLAEVVDKAAAETIDRLSGRHTPKPKNADTDLEAELNTLLADKLAAAKLRIQPLLPRTSRAGSTVTSGKLETVPPAA